MMRGKTNNKGFSLVELIVVIAIMAVLVGILAPTLIKYVDKSRRSTDSKNISEYVTNIQTYASDHEDMAGTSGTITLTTGKATIDQKLYETALADAGITLADMKLKSKAWGEITLTINIDSAMKMTTSIKQKNPTSDDVDINKMTGITQPGSAGGTTDTSTSQ